MLTKEEIKKWLLENCVDECGNLDLDNLDFSDFNGDILASYWKVNRALFQRYHIVGGSLFQDNQKVGESLYQNFQKVNGDLHQNMQTIGNRLYNNQSSKWIHQNKLEDEERNKE